jgi:hypothetical protein
LARAFSYFSRSSCPTFGATSPYCETANSVDKAAIVQTILEIFRAEAQLSRADFQRLAQP